MKKNTQAFADPFVALIIFSVSLMGSMGIGVVWMRHQISSTAIRNQQLVAQHHELERLIMEKDSEVASAQRHDQLRKLNDTHKLGMVTWSEVPIVAESSEAAVRGLVQRASLELMDRAPVVTIKIAQH